jgi:(2Fe-2S) ferredoxin
MDRRADKLYKQLQPMIDELNGDTYPPLVRLEIANCLSMCGAGPNCLIHPGALPFNHLDAGKLKAIVEEYLKED